MEKIIVVLEKKYTVSLENPVIRFENNPVITCHDVNKVWKEPYLKVVTVHNSGITIFNDNTIMLFRSHLRNGISVIGMATSKNGLTRWNISNKPFLKPCTFDDEVSENVNKLMLIENEAGGVEDVRISHIGDTYFLTYSAYHAVVKDRVRVSLATTKDFETVVRYGPLSDIDMRNVVIFPEKFGDKYYALFRPNDHTAEETGGRYTEILLGYSLDVTGNDWKFLPEPVMKQAGGPSFFSDKIGPGATPIKTKYGWINIFHGVRKTMGGNLYFLGVALHDLNDPRKIRVANFPVLFPSKADCRVNETDYVHVRGVVFTCGAIRKADGTLLIYYGGNDTVMNIGLSHEDVLSELCKCYQQDSQTGRALYKL